MQSSGVALQLYRERFLVVFVNRSCRELRDYVFWWQA